MNANLKIFAAGLILGVALTAIAAGCGKFKKPSLVVHEPAAPGESTLSYTPHPRPSPLELTQMLSGDAGSINLFATAGETPDHLAVWMPAERVLFCGDLSYHSFPNLSTPMLEARPVSGLEEDGTCR